MKPQELRIGNRILGVYTDEDENGEEIEVVCECIVGVLDIFDQTEHDIWVTGGDEREYYYEFRPIPLTEEQLLRFGFGKVQNIYQRHNQILLDPESNGSYKVKFWTHSISRAEPLYQSNLAIRYVHQLQNLYFALTGEELTKTQTLN